MEKRRGGVRPDDVDEEGERGDEVEHKAIVFVGGDLWGGARSGLCDSRGGSNGFRVGAVGRGRSRGCEWRAEERCKGRRGWEWLVPHCQYFLPSPITGDNERAYIQ